MVDRRLQRLSSVFALETTLQSEIRERVMVILKEFLSRDKVSSKLPPESLSSWFEESRTPERSIVVDKYLDLLEETIVPHSVNMSSPRCIGHMTNVPPSFVWPLAELVVALNQNLLKWEASKTLTLVERQTIAMIHRWVYGYPEEFYKRHAQDLNSTLGVMVSGGTIANITALWIARNLCFGPANGFEGVEREGTHAALDYYGYLDAVIIGSKLMHYSLEKAAGVLGLGTRSVIKLPVDAAGRLELSALRDCINDCIRQRRRIVALVGIAGSTDCGSIDPLQDLARIAREFGIYFHVDAAWGTPLLLSREHGRRLAGIELADSVTADAHKQLHLPIGSSVLLLKRTNGVLAIEKQGSYVLQNGSGDLGRHSLEGSRPANSLFVHAALHIIGREGYEFLVDESIRKARFMADSISRLREFELLMKPETNVVVYRYLPEAFRVRAENRSLTPSDNQQISEYNERIQKAQYREGRSFVSRTTFEHAQNGNPVPVVALRAVLGNPFTGEEDIAEVLRDQLTIASRLQGAMAESL